jgi:hypothetical protein
VARRRKVPARCRCRPRERLRRAARQRSCGGRAAGALAGTRVPRAASGAAGERDTKSVAEVAGTRAGERACASSALVRARCAPTRSTRHCSHANACVTCGLGAPARRFRAPFVACSRVHAALRPARPHRCGAASARAPPFSALSCPRTHATVSARTRTRQRKPPSSALRIRSHARPAQRAQRAARSSARRSSAPGRCRCTTGRAGSQRRA